MAHGFVLVVRCPGRSFHDTSRGTTGPAHRALQRQQNRLPQLCQGQLHRLRCHSSWPTFHWGCSVNLNQFWYCWLLRFPSVRSRQSSWFLPLTCLEWSWHSCHAGGVVEELPEAERNQQKEPRVVADERCLGALCSLQSYLYWDNFRGAQDLGIMW